jgi:hypothetical protein
VSRPTRLPRRESGRFRARQSLPSPLRPFVPSFYFWDFSSYWTYPPNIAAFGLVLALLTMGTLPIVAPTTRRRMKKILGFRTASLYRM